MVDVGALDGHKVGRCSQACDVLPCGLGVVDSKSHSDTQRGRYERNGTLLHISTELLTLKCETGPDDGFISQVALVPVANCSLTPSDFTGTRPSLANLE